MKDEQYLRILDTYARFYNSQATAHVGYGVTVTAFVAGTGLSLLISFVARSDPLLPKGGESYELVVRGALLLSILAGAVVYSFWGFHLLSFKYLVGRLQYYIQLSHIVWEHMGAKSPPKGNPKEDFMQKLKNRALKVGIEQAITTLFEARLYVSGCSRQRYNRGRPLGDIKESERDEEDQNLMMYFCEVSQDVLQSRHPYTTRMFRYDFDNLLYLAYKKQINQYCKPPEEKRDDKEYKKLQTRGELLRKALDP